MPRFVFDLDRNGHQNLSQAVYVTHMQIVNK